MKKSYRVKKELDFQKVFETHNSVANRKFIIYQLDKPEQKHFRVGISVGKKIGNAVVRNHVKRMMREVFRHHKMELLTNVQLIWVARKKLAAADLKTYDRVFMRLAKRAALLK